MKKILTLMILVFGLVGFIGCSNPINVDYDELPKVEQEAPQVVEPVEEILRFGGIAYKKQEMEVVVSKLGNELNIKEVYYCGRKAQESKDENGNITYKYYIEESKDYTNILDFSAKIESVSENKITAFYDWFFYDDCGVQFGYKPSTQSLKGKYIVLERK